MEKADWVKGSVAVVFIAVDFLLFFLVVKKMFDLQMSLLVSGIITVTLLVGYEAVIKILEKRNILQPATRG